MGVYKPKQLDRRTGRRRPTDRWYVRLKDHLGIERRFAAFTDRRLSEQFEEYVRRLIDYRANGEELTADLSQWVRELDDPIREKLIAYHIIPPERTLRSQPLDQHIEDFERWLTDTKGPSGFHRSPDYICTVMRQVRRVVRDCGFKRWGDMKKAAVEIALGRMVVSNKTYNDHLASLKHFCTWMVDNDRAEFSPVTRIKRLNVSDERTRMALDACQIERLLAAAAKAPKRFGMTGLERVALYRLGMETGFRRNELAHLRVGDFDLQRATVTLNSQFCKDRRNAEQLISFQLADHLRTFFEGEPQKEWAFTLGPRSAEMICQDAADAGIPLVNDRGHRLTFHSLRHTCRTTLARKFVPNHVIDAIMRHKPQDIGRKNYTDVTPLEKRQAIEKLDLPWPRDLLEQSVARTA